MAKNILPGRGECGSCKASELGRKCGPLLPKPTPENDTSTTEKGMEGGTEAGKEDTGTQNKEEGEGSG